MGVFLAHAPDVSARAEHDVTARQVGQLRDAEPGLQSKRQQRTITTAMPRRQIWRGADGISVRTR